MWPSRFCFTVHDLPVQRFGQEGAIPATIVRRHRRWYAPLVWPSGAASCAVTVMTPPVARHRVFHRPIHRAGARQRHTRAQAAQVPGQDPVLWGHRYPIAVLKDVLTRVDVDTVLCHNHYSLSDTQLLKLVPLAAEKQVGLIAAPLGSSLLTEKGTAVASRVRGRSRRRLAGGSICPDQGTTLERLAIQFATANEQVPLCW